jgi:hypothetical protein
MRENERAGTSVPDKKQLSQVGWVLGNLPGN